MTRVFRTVAIAILSLALTAPMAEAQGPNIQITGVYGFGGGFSPYGGFGFSPYGGYGYGMGPYGGFGYNPYPGYGGFPGGFGYGGLGYGGFGYGPFNYSQQLFQQQASLTQQIFQQKQLAILGQIQAAQSRLEGLEATKQQLFQQYLDKNDTEKAAVRAGLMRDFLGLDPVARGAWKRDTVVQIIIGQDIERLEGLAEFREMSEPDKDQFRQAMLEKYRALPAADQQAWQRDQIVGNILGRDWWLK
jgi:hypothetical protein